jgi:hypothetical protein
MIFPEASLGLAQVARLGGRMPGQGRIHYAICKGCTENSFDTGSIDPRRAQQKSAVIQKRG